MTKKDEFYLRIRFNEDLHARFKAACALSGKTMKEAIEEALEMYLKSREGK